MSTFKVGQRVRMCVQVEAFASEKGTIVRHDPTRNPHFPWQVRPDKYAAQLPGLWFAERELEPVQPTTSLLVPAMGAASLGAACLLTLLILAIFIPQLLLILVGVLVWLVGMVWLSWLLNRKKGKNNASVQP